MVRAMWNVPSGPIPDLTELIERAGAVVVLGAQWWEMRGLRRKRH
jgi:hypothetical protein